MNNFGNRIRKAEKHRVLTERLGTEKWEKSLKYLTQGDAKERKESEWSKRR
jgi:hypothetical protein